MGTTRTRRRVVVDDRPLANAIGQRLRQARLAAGLTQQQLAGERYTKAYISALEHGIAKPSMAALNYLAPRLGTTASQVLSDPSPAWARVEADLALAAGDLSTALSGYRSLLEHAEERAARAELNASIGEALCRLDRAPEAIRHCSEAARTFADLGRPEDRARAEYTLASAHFQQDNPDEARALLRGILERIRAGLDLGGDFQARVLISLGMTESGSGNPSAGLAYLEEARGLAGDLDLRRRGAFLAALARAYRDGGDLEGAIRTGLQAQALFRAAAADVEIGLVENHLALAYLANGSADRALTTVRDARTGAGADPILRSHLADTEATILLEMGDADQALALSDEAIDLARSSGNAKGLIDALTTRARALAARGDHEAAAAAFERAAQAAEPAVPAIRRREIYSAWADTLAALGRHGEAYALARKALASG